MKKIVSVLRGKHAPLLCVAAALLFGVFMFFFRREFLLWERLPLVGALFAAGDLCFAFFPAALYARWREKHILPVFLGAALLFAALTWGILTVVNVDGLYNLKAIRAALGAVLVPFAVPAFLTLRSLCAGKHRTLLRIAAAALTLVYAAVFWNVVVFEPESFAQRADVFLHGGERAYFEKWNETQPFTRDYAVELEMAPDRDFVILNLADIQMDDEEIFGADGARVRRTIDRLVTETKPDLITLSGDNALETRAYLETIRMIDGYGIPWAPVMGNHDGQGCPGEFWCAYQFTRAENCLFRFGPAGMGYGNYIINLVRDGRIVHTLYLMDTHDHIEKDNPNGKADSGYDHLWPNQLSWYAWAADGIRAVEGRTVESTAIMHIPLYEYGTAWYAATGLSEGESESDAPYVGAYAETCFGVRLESGGWPPQSNGFFDLLREKGSTKNVLCGHVHKCDSSILYEGIRLTYSLKTGSGGYFEPTLSGGTTLTVDGEGHVTVEHHLVDFYAE